MLGQEVRTPLNGMLGLVDLLAATPLTPQQARYVASARASAGRLARVVADLVDMSRLAAGTLPIAHVAFDLADLIESAIDGAIAEAPSRSGVLTCTMASSLPSRVTGDPGRLRQVVVHVLTLAMATPGAAGVHVHAHAESESDARRADVTLECVVAGSPSTTAAVPASPALSGAALEVCRRLLEAMQGSLLVRHPDGDAAAYTIAFPIACEPAGQATASPALPMPLRTVEGRRPRVLVVDAVGDTGPILCAMLSSLGCDAEGVAEARDSGERAVDVVLLLAATPDDVAAMRRARPASRTLPVIAPRVVAISPLPTLEAWRALAAAGADAYLGSPVRDVVLRRTLQRLLAAVPAAEAVGADVVHRDDILDPAEVMRRCNHNADLGARMLELFAQTLPKELARLETAAAAGDVEAVRHVAHKLRGAAATLAAVRLAGAIAGIELFLKYGDGGPLLDRVADVRHESALLLGVVPSVLGRLHAGER